MSNSRVVVRSGLFVPCLLIVPSKVRGRFERSLIKLGVLHGGLRSKEKGRFSSIGHILSRTPFIYAITSLHLRGIPTSLRNQRLDVANAIFTIEIKLIEICLPSCFHRLFSLLAHDWEAENAVSADWVDRKSLAQGWGRFHRS